MKKNLLSRNLSSIAFVFLMLFAMACICSDKKEPYSSPSYRGSTYAGQNGNSLSYNSNSSNSNTALGNGNFAAKSFVGKSSKSRRATVIAENANLRKSANSNAEVTQTVSEGATLQIVKQQGAWFFVKSDDNQTGWLHGNTIRLEDVGDSTNSLPDASTSYSIKPSLRESENTSSGASARCSDGTLSYSAHRRGTCSHHGGVSVWY